MTVGDIMLMPSLSHKTIFFCDKKGNRIFDLDASYVSWEAISTEMMPDSVWVHVVPNKKLAEAFWNDIKGTVKAADMPYLLTIEEIAKLMKKPVEKMLSIMWGLTEYGYTQREFICGVEEPYWVVE